MTDTPLSEGVHLGVPDAKYHADPCGAPSLSSTLARVIIGQSPLHAWTQHPRLNPNYEPEEKKQFDIGRAAHRAVLGVGAEYEAIPNDLLSADGGIRTKAAREWVDDARERGVTPLKQSEVEAIYLMCGRVHDRLDQAKTWLDIDRSELVAVAEIDGAMCRVMIDNAPEDPAQPLWDFKTTTDASPNAVMRAVMNYGYDVQAAFYLDVWKAATGEDRAFRFIFQEKAAPYEVCIVELNGEALAMGRKKVTRAREIWRECLKADHWPGYPTGVHQIALPPWFAERWLERESAEADFRRQYGHDILDQARRWQAP